MSAEHEHDSTVAHCHCGNCMMQGETAFDLSNARTYYVPDPPTIPLPPGSTVTTAPPDTGFRGPRFLTLIRGDDWNDPQVATPVVIPYTFATRAMSNYTTGQTGFELTSGEPLEAVQQASIRQALGLWEQVAGITFIEVPDTAAWEFAGIRFLMEKADYVIEDGGIFDLYGIALPSEGDVYGFNVVLNANHYGNHPLAPGTEAFWTTLHEIGHALGLKHPFQDPLVLSESEDNTRNTVMSYTDKRNYSGLGAFDAAAVQYLYGTPEQAAAAAIRWSRGADGSLVINGDGTANAIIGLDIRDVVFGHGAGDLIRTNGGNDYVVGGEGSDAVFGGAGLDTLHTGWLRRQASVAVGRDTEGGIQGTVAQPDGVDSFYEVEVLRFLDGDVILSPQSAAGQAYRLYVAAFGRAPDPTGLGTWAEALGSGAVSLSGAAAGFANSAEFAARYGAPSDVGFVTQLYANVLGRAPDAPGLASWMNAIQNPAIGRAGVLFGFSESAENQARTANAFTNGMWVANTEAVDVLRAYVAVLDRLPDGGGLANWTAARENGLAQSGLVEQFVASGEFQARFGGLSNRDFVDQLYRTALDRQGDPNGMAAWTYVLDAGIDGRAGVALGFASSVELSVKITPWVADGILYG